MTIFNLRRISLIFVCLLMLSAASEQDVMAEVQRAYSSLQYLHDLSSTDKYKGFKICGTSVFLAEEHVQRAIAKGFLPHETFVPEVNFTLQVSSGASVSEILERMNEGKN